MRLANSVTVSLIAFSAAGCPFMVQPSNSRDVDREVVTAATMPELFDRFVKDGKMGTISATTTEEPLYEKEGAPRLRIVHPAYSAPGSTVVGGFSPMTFVRAQDDKLCFLTEWVVKKGKDKADILIAQKSDWELVPWALYTVSDLNEVRSRAQIWPAPAEATSFTDVTPGELYAATRNLQVSVVEICAPMPPRMDRGFLVLQAHNEEAKNDLDVTKALDESDDRRATRLNAKFGVDSLIAWKLKGPLGGSGSTTSAPGPAGVNKARPSDSKPPISATDGVMSIAKSSVGPMSNVVVKFSKPMKAAPGEKFWITIVSAGADDTAYTSYKYLDPNATRIELAAPGTAGDYEVRLHGNYPTKTYNVLHRIMLTVR